MTPPKPKQSAGSTHGQGGGAAIAEPTGPTLGQLLLLGTVLLVLVITGLSGVLQVVATEKDFAESSSKQSTRLKEQVREAGHSIANLMALTATGPLRDNNFSALADLVKSVASNDANVLRAQVLDGDGNVVADTDPGKEPDGKGKRVAEERVAPGMFKNHTVFEYQTPIVLSPSSPRGLVVLVYSLDALQVEMSLLEEAKRASVSRITRRTVLLGSVMVLLASLFAMFQGRRIIRPIQLLTEQARQMAQGDTTFRAQGNFTRAGREVALLHETFNAMSDRIVGLAGESGVKAGLLEEMQLAKKVTETVMPGREVFEYGPLRLAGSVNPAEQCGGDWWVQAQLDEARLAVGIGDVAGHGLSTALIATSAVSAFSAVLTTHHADNVDAAIVLQALNSTLFHFGKGEYQMSCAVLVFDLFRGELQFANGGHPLPCVYNRNDRQVISLAARGPLIGKAQRFDCTPTHVKLRPGDVLVWYSDGLVECRDAGGQQYGWKRLVSAAQRFGDLPADEMREAILAEARTFSAGHSAEDDITVVVAEYMPAAEAAPDAPEPQFADDGQAAQDPFAADPAPGHAEADRGAHSGEDMDPAPFVDTTEKHGPVPSQADTQPLEVSPAANEAPQA